MSIRLASAHKEQGMQEVNDISSSKLSQLLYERFLEWRKDQNFFSWLEALLPTWDLEALGMIPAGRQAHQFLAESIARLPIVIDEISYDWLARNGLKREVVNLKRVSTLAGYHRTLNRVCRCSQNLNVAECITVELFKKNVTYKINFDAVKFDLNRNVLLGCLPPGFVKRLMGWPELAYCSDEHAVYGILPPHEEGRRSRWVRNHSVSVDVVGRIEVNVLDRAEEFEQYLNSSNAAFLDASIASEILVKVGERIDSSDGRNRDELAKLHHVRRRIVGLLRKNGFVLSEDMSTVVREFKPKSLL